MRRLVAAFLALRFLDAWADFLGQGVIFFYLSDVLGASDSLASLTLGLRGVFVSVYLLCFGGYLSTFPSHGPLLALSYMAAPQMLALTGCILLGWFAGAGSFWAYALATALIALVFAGGEALGHNAFDLTVQAVWGKDERVRQVLFFLLYPTHNLAALTSSATTLLLLSTIPNRTQAILAILGVAVGLLLLAALGASYLSAHLRRAFPHSYAPADRGTQSLSNPGWRDVWQRQKERALRPDVGRFLLLSGPMQFGLAVLYAAQTWVLPKLLERQYGQATTFPLTLAINPALVLLLSPLVAWAKQRGWFPTTSLAGYVSLCIVVQALAPLWILAQWPGGLTSVCLFLAQSSVGEALGQPAINALTAGSVDVGLLPFSLSLSQIPRALERYAILTLSGKLLATSTGPDDPTLWAVLLVWCFAAALCFVIYWYGEGLGREGSAPLTSPPRWFALTLLLTYVPLAIGPLLWKLSG